MGLLKFFLGLSFLIIYLLKPPIGFAFNTSDPSVSLLQNRISNNFSRKYCKAIQNGFSKDEAMKSAIVKTENIIPLKKKLIVNIKLYKMFDLRELNLMFLDPTDLIINNINKYLYSNKAIKFIFS